MKWTTPRGHGESAFAGEGTVPSSPSLLLSNNFKKMALFLFSTMGKKHTLLGILKMPELILTLLKNETVAQIACGEWGNLGNAQMKVFL